MQMHFIQLQHNSTKRECTSGNTVKPVKPENSRIFCFQPTLRLNAKQRRLHTMVAFGNGFQQGLCVLILSQLICSASGIFFSFLDLFLFYFFIFFLFFQFVVVH